MKTFRLSTDTFKNSIQEISCGDEILLSGTVYTARDAAHKKLVSLIQSGKDTPFTIKDSFIYYAGPTPERDSAVCGSFGPTTSSRMDPYSPLLLDMGLLCMIGKGPRNKDVIDAIIRNKAIYLCALGGAGALAAKCIKSLEVIAFPELGCESVKKLTFENFPLICGIDSSGNSLFK